MPVSRKSKNMKKSSKISKSHKKNVLQKKRKTMKNMRKMRGGAKDGDHVYHIPSGLYMGYIIGSNKTNYFVKPADKEQTSNFPINKDNEFFTWSILENKDTSKGIMTKELFKEFKTFDMLKKSTEA